MNTISAFLLIVFALVTGMNRAAFVGHMVDIFERQTGHEVVIDACPFTDTDDVRVLKAWTIGITAGTSQTTFSPTAKVEPYQAFIFVGKTLYAISKAGELW
jgi:hypothetical protein